MSVSELSFDGEAQRYTGEDQEDVIYQTRASDALSKVMSDSYVNDNEAAETASQRHGQVNDEKHTNSSSTSSAGSTESKDQISNHSAYGFFGDMVRKLNNVTGGHASTKSMLIAQFCITNVMLAAVCLSVICIYWGAAYRTEHYLYKVTVLSVDQDQGYGSVASIGESLPEFIKQVPGTWHQYNTTSFSNKFGSDSSSEEINKKVTQLIYKEKYWLSFNLKAGATENLYKSLTDPDAEPFNSSAFFEVVFESGRDPTNLKSSILPIMQELEGIFVDYFNNVYLPSLINNITVSDGISLNDIPAQNLANAGKMEFQYTDYRPFYDRVLLAPLQVGLIYTLILTVLQLSLYGPLHAKMARVFKPKHLLIYRYSISWATYFILSLFFCTVSAVFQVDFTKAFGRGGFVIYWASTFLTMLAVGGANENVISMIVAYGPQYMALWLITWIILNISPSFYPMVLNDQFYRYGYAMPLHNAVDIYRVVFLNLHRGKLGRNYGILAAWVVLNHVLFPFVMKIVGQKMKKNAIAQAQTIIAAHEARKAQQ